MCGDASSSELNLWVGDGPVASRIRYD